MPKPDNNRKMIILNYINEYYEQHIRTPAAPVIMRKKTSSSIFVCRYRSSARVRISR